MERFQQLQLPHRHICDMVSMYLGVDPNEVLEAAADDEAHIEILNNFIRSDGIIGFIVYYQEGPSYEIGKSPPRLYNFNVWLEI